MVISELRGSVRPYTLYSVVDWHRRKRIAISGRKKEWQLVVGEKEWQLVVGEKEWQLVNYCQF